MLKTVVIGNFEDNPWFDSECKEKRRALHGELKSHLRGQFPDLEFFVDRWPHPQAALARVDPDGQQLRCQNFFRKSVEGIYSENEDALNRLLTDPEVIDWNTRTYFSSMHASLQPVMQTIAQQMGRRVQFDHNVLVKTCPRLFTPVYVDNVKKFSKEKLEHTMRGSAVAIVIILSSALAVTSAVTNIQRCLGSKNEQLCMYCCRRLSSSERSDCEGRCPDVTRAWQLLLTCTDNPRTCISCCIRALTVLSYRPDLLRQCNTNCSNALALGNLG
ncbi:hypothetical protein ACOMHN_009870 [Nucella lapillus]